MAMDMEEPAAPDQVPSAARSPPGPEDIRAQLERIMASPEFPGTGRCSAFLTYIVQEVLEGRAKRLKGYSVAIEVFGRHEGFTQDDPVVRIEAGRLRRALERYYLIAGRDEPLTIEVPKGGYVPRFSWSCPLREIASSIEIAATSSPSSGTAGTTLWSKKWATLAALAVAVVLAVAAMFAHPSAVRTVLGRPNPTASNAAPSAPTLVVIPFAGLGESADARTYALGLTEELLTALPRFKEIQVFGRETSEALSSEVGAAHVRGALGADYLLTGGVRLSGNHVRVTARVLDTQTNAILWSQDYDDDLNTQGLMAIQTDVANKVATTVAQPYGIISTAAASRFTPNDLDAYGCTLQFYAYRADLNAPQHAYLRTCLESAIARYPTYATAWAMLSMIYLDEHRFKYNQKSGSPTALERSLQAARRAVQLDPDNTRGLQALMTALFFNKQPEESLRVGEEAVTINPNDTELLSEFGTRLAMSGQWGRGKSMLEAALARNPGRAGYYHGIVALADYMQKDNLAAVAQIRQADQQKFPLFQLVAAIVYQQAGMPDETARASASFAKLGPDFLVHLRDEIEERVLQPQDKERIIESLRRAGLRAPDDQGVALAGDPTIGR
jgi:TolB-like protein